MHTPNYFPTLRSVSKVVLSGRVSFLILMIVLLGLSACKKRWDGELEDRADLEKCVEQEMDKQHIPAMAVLIFKGDQVLYEKYFGYADVDQEISLTADHPFLLASVSKTVTGTALMQLAEQGSVDLDANINDYLPFAVNSPYSSQSISPRMLLNHTSGIADGSAMDGQYFYGEDSPVALSFFMENYLVPGGQYYNGSENYYDFDPGTDHEYSNSGSALIGVLVEAISGTDFNTYCKQNIFQPLGMTNTAWRLDEIQGTIVMPYQYRKRKYESIGHYTFTDYPNGGLRSTARDLHRFFQAFVLEGTSNGHALLAPSQVSQMLSPQVPNLDATVGLHFFQMDAQHDLWGHDGGEQGVSTTVGFNKATDVGVIVLANNSDLKLEQLMISAYQLGLTL